MIKPILVCVHIYYADLWPAVKEAMKAIGTWPFELYVTTVSDNMFLKKEVLHDFKKAHFEIVENVGYDVGPFVHILGSVDLSKYSYVIKLHSKRDMPIGAHINYYDVSGSKWRDYAMCFLKDEDAFKKTVQAFEKDDSIGMVTDYRLIVSKEKDDQNAAKKALRLLEKCGLKTDKFAFVAGSIFMCRADCLKVMQNLNISLQDFEKPDKKHRASTLAHAIERLFGLLILAQNKKICDVVNVYKKNSILGTLFRRIQRFIFVKKENKEGKIKIKICKIPVWVYQKERIVK